MILFAPPFYALTRVWTALHPGLVAAAALVMSCVTFAVYGIDKRRAQAGGWRIPETNLHVLDLLGGWPGGLIAQRYFRHKTGKWTFQAVFWLTVLVHEAVALDAILGWRIARMFGGGW